MPLISFEGAEGCGKSTQVKLLARRLQTANLPVLVLREPGGTPIGEVIRDLLQHSEVNRAMCPETELLLFVASRAQLVRERILPALEEGVFVLCDRFFDSTTVYQGVGRKLDNHFLQTLNAFAVGQTRPELTFILEIDRATACSRLAGRSQPRRDRMEEQPPEFHDAVRTAYGALGKSEPDRIVTIDGNRPEREIEDRIWERLTQKFPELNLPSARS